MLHQADRPSRETSARQKIQNALLAAFKVELWANRQQRSLLTCHSLTVTVLTEFPH